jgi:hypothetical protein
MKLKQLASFLQEIDDFANPKFELEQYKTGAELAARILFTIENSYGDIQGKLVGDLGAFKKCERLEGPYPQSQSSCFWVPKLFSRRLWHRHSRDWLRDPWR